MIAKYKMPIMGKVKSRTPLKGDPENPLCLIPFIGLLGEYTTLSYRVIDYDLNKGVAEIEVEADEATHQAIEGLLPQLEQIKKDKGWRLIK